MQVVLGIVLVAAFSVACALSARLIRQRLGPDTIEKSQQPAAEFFLAATAGLYGVLLAFVLESSVVRYRESRAHAIAEIAGVLHVAELARGLSPPAGEGIADAAQGYLRILRATGWTEVPEPGGAEELARMRTLLIGYRPIDLGQVSLHAESLRYIAEVDAMRDSRLFAARRSTPVFLWLILIVGEIYMMATTMLASMRPYLHTALVVGLALLTSMCLLGIYLLSLPFASVPWSDAQSILRAVEHP